MNLRRVTDLFCQLLNVYDIHELRQTEMHMAEPIVPEPSFVYICI